MFASNSLCLVLRLFFNDLQNPAKKKRDQLWCRTEKLVWWEGQGWDAGDPEATEPSLHEELTEAADGTNDGAFVLSLYWMASFVIHVKSSSQ